MSLTVDRLRDLLTYCADTGCFRWRKNMKGGKRAGDLAGSQAVHGYVTIRLDGRLYYAHRLAWLIVHGAWPECEIDHENGVRNDNRLSNLRPASRKQQLGNLRLPANASGRRGVYRDRHGKKWIAQIHRDGRQVHLGTFETIDQAASAYKDAAERHFGQFARCDR